MPQIRPKGAPYLRFENRKKGSIIRNSVTPGVSKNTGKNGQKRACEQRSPGILRTVDNTVTSWQRCAQGCGRGLCGETAEGITQGAKLVRRRTESLTSSQALQARGRHLIDWTVPMRYNDNVIVIVTWSDHRGIYLLVASQSVFDKNKLPWFEPSLLLENAMLSSYFHTMCRMP